ncbi:MAG: hypothetical protein ACK2UC_14595 [Anaerolineae bacterium]|jgi:hypothetical protein
MKVAIRRFQLSSLGRMGCLLGVVAAFLPSLLCGLLGVGLAEVLHRWLAGWQQVPISILGTEITTLDFVRLLGLEGALQALDVLTTATGAVLLLAVLGIALVSGLFLALITILVGLAYNLLATATGGVLVEIVPGTRQAPPE